MKKQLIETLIDKKITLSVAESCTGGLFSASIVDVAGSSQTLKEAIVVYSNEAKMKYLNVSKETLHSFGAVSEEVAKEMVVGLNKTANTDISVSITGIAGPDGGSLDKPVGLVYIGVSYNNQVFVFEHHFTGERNEIRKKAVIATYTHIEEVLGEVK